MTRLTLASAALALSVGTASAQVAVIVYDPATMIPAEQITDGGLYTTSAAWEADTAFDAFDDAWESIGDVEDLILDETGQVVGLVAEVGGFLGLGEHDVFVPAEDLRLVRRDDSWAYVTRYTQEELEALPELDDDVWDD